MMPPARPGIGIAFGFFLNLIIFLFDGPCSGADLSQVQPRTGLETKTILVLHSHEANAPVFTGTDQGLTAALQSGGIPLLNQTFESLELRRYPLPEHRRLLAEQMRLRHGRRKPDMIVTMYPEALEFVLQHCGDIFPDVPLLALYLTPGFEVPQTAAPIIRHFPRVDVAGTFEIALKLVPGAKRVYVVSGAHAVDRTVEAQARRELQKWEGRLEFSYLSHLPFEDLLAALSSSPPDTIVLLLINTHDSAGKPYLTPSLTQQLSKVSRAPIFGLLHSALGHGMVGGSLIDFETIGNRAGELILDIFKGLPDRQGLPKVMDVPPVPMFDWRQLKRWDLSPSALPEKSVFINREFTLWDLKYYIVAALVFILAQSLLILMLLAQKRRRESAEGSLRQKTDELDRFFRVTLDLLCIANTEGYFLRLNPAWEKVLGYSREELMANRFFNFVHPDDLAGTREAVSKLALQRELIHFENRYRCKDGTYRLLEWTSASAGELIYAAARDITERMEAEAEERQRREELAHMARVSTMGELAGALAHEINQPLSAIMSNAQAAKRYLEAPNPDMEEVKEILRDIVREDARAGEVINRLRMLLRKSKTELEPLDFNSIFEETIGLLHSDAIIRDINLSTELEAGLPLVPGDRVQLQQVALNLILNAFEAMNEQPPGEKRVMIRTWQKDSEVLASVADSGGGIPAEETEKIFKPFYTTKPQGLGMGLSISRSIINRHQGRIWVENNPDRGATFFLSIPVQAEERIVSRK